MRDTNAAVLATLLALEQVQQDLQNHPRWEQLRPHLEALLQSLSETRDPEAQAAICLEIEDLVAEALGPRWWALRNQTGERFRGVSEQEHQALVSLARFFGLPGLIFIPPTEEEPQGQGVYCCPRCGYRSPQPGRCPEHHLELRLCEDEG